MPPTSPLPAGLLFRSAVLGACAMALVLGDRSPSDIRRARMARVARYCRARGLRGPVSAWKVQTARQMIAARFAEADRF